MAWSDNGQITYSSNKIYSIAMDLIYYYLYEYGWRMLQGLISWIRSCAIFFKFHSVDLIKWVFTHISQYIFVIFRLFDVKSEDGGVYYCYARNSQGSSPLVRLIVQIGKISRLYLCVSSKYYISYVWNWPLFS